MPPRSLESLFLPKTREIYVSLRFFYGFGRVSLSQKPFHHQNLIWSQAKIVKNRKCHQDHQNLFFSQKLEKFTIVLRFWYDFGQNHFQTHKKKIVKKIISETIKKNHIQRNKKNK